MTNTLAFDVYGTLIDTHGVVTALQGIVGDRAAEFSTHWRDKQLEYSFRRGLMQNYQPFSVCTRNALEYVCSALKTSLSTEQKDFLMDTYSRLPAFADTVPGLTSLQDGGHRLFAFSNGAKNALEVLLSAASIRDYFIDLVSVDEVKSFKPNPAVYSYFLRTAGASGADAWMVSSNPFDVIGAASAGMKSVWVKRSSGAILDPWGIEPTLTVSSLEELGTCLT